MELSAIYYLHEVGAKKNQEDYIWPVPGTADLRQRVFIVCDGVGGSENGEIASRIVAESVGQALLQMDLGRLDTVSINRLLLDARIKLLHFANANGLRPDMATTFALLVLSDPDAFVAWCGDSRVYHIHKGNIVYKTFDHSLVNSLVKTGEITEEEALAHPQRNIILKAVRADESDPEADAHWIRKVHDGDYFLLCTDGLLENVGERELKFLLEQNDGGSIDLVQSFQQFCYGKTNDNYSMYLVKIRTTSGPKVKKRITVLLLLLLSLLLVGAIFVKVNYFTKKPTMDTIVPVNIDKDSTAFPDSSEGSRTSNAPSGATATQRSDSAAQERPANRKTEASPDSGRILK